jgi:hypothetical protein
MATKKHPWKVLRTWTSSSSGETYEFREGADGRVYCTCKGWHFGNRCSHLDEWMKETAKAEALRAAVEAFWWHENGPKGTRGGKRGRDSTPEKLGARRSFVR